jgi:DNA-directed RNA polymerase III subunit RPC1
MLTDESSESLARQVKAALERTKLGDVAKDIYADVGPQDTYVCIQLDEALIQRLKLNITAASVRRCILADKKLKLKDQHIR